MDRGAWWVPVHRVPKSPTQLKWLSMHACMPIDLPELIGLAPVSYSPRGKGPGEFSLEKFGSLERWAISPGPVVRVAHVLCLKLSFGSPSASKYLLAHPPACYQNLQSTGGKEGCLPL